MKKILYLSTCSTCNRIIKELNGLPAFEHQNIKTNHISEETLDHLEGISGSYESLFNKRAMKYRKEGLNKKSLTEEQFKKLILAEYTYLKRPIILINEHAFIGNAKSTVAAAKEMLASL